MFGLFWGKKQLGGKDFGEKNQNIKVNFNQATGAAEVFTVKTVVEIELAADAEARADGGG